ncbi:unnamed protein product [Prorocentrum cordatum]|uniref:Uncharacterized protein n=1 Tax=Prorocentrum cordatum TaxID=2364126 RepID=A0ABN9XS87_9DINO|nr:unnamed protein product [Polarella glacialis]
MPTRIRIVDPYVLDLCMHSLKALLDACCSVGSQATFADTGRIQAALIDMRSNAVFLEEFLHDLIPIVAATLNEVKLIIHDRLVLPWMPGKSCFKIGQITGAHVRRIKTAPQAQGAMFEHVLVQCTIDI